MTPIPFHPAAATRPVAEDVLAFFRAEDAFVKKWHQDNCPERGDFPRWYRDKANARTLLDQYRAALIKRLEEEVAP